MTDAREYESEPQVGYFWPPGRTTNNPSLLHRAEHRGEPERGLAMDLAGLSEADLLSMLGQVFRELRRRGMIRTDSFTAEIGEYWGKKLLNLELARTGTPGIDATKGSMRYQIKTRRIYPGARSTESTRRVPDTHIGEYDYLLLVILDEWFVCTEIWQTPKSAFRGKTDVTVKWIQDNPASKKIWPLAPA